MLRKCIPVAVTIALLSACSSSPKIKVPTDNERYSQMYLESGTEVLVQEKYSEALAAFLDAIRYNPKSLEAWNNLGLAYYGLHQPEKAKESWLKALALDPKYTEAKTNLGALSLEQNRLSEAEARFKEVLRDLLYNKSYLAHYNLAIIYLREGKSILAEEHLNLAVKANKTYCAAWHELGKLAENRGDHSLAAERFRGATMGFCYNNPEGHYLLAHELIEAGNQRAAREKLVELMKNFGSTEWGRKAENDLSLLDRSASEPR